MEHGGVPCPVKVVTCNCRVVVPVNGQPEGLRVSDKGPERIGRKEERSNDMRIEAYNQIQQVYNAKRVRPVKGVEQASATDNVQISSIGKDILTAKNAVKNVPDVREDLVASIREKLQKGSYDVDAGSFADKLMERFEATV